MHDKYETMEQALDHAIEILADKFDKPDQSATVALAQALYTMQARERFDQRDRDSESEIPYSA